MAVAWSLAVVGGIKHNTGLWPSRPFSVPYRTALSHCFKNGFIATKDWCAAIATTLTTTRQLIEINQ
jgi:hypothetical protein